MSKKVHAPATRKYTVTIPLSGAIHIRVAATDEDDARAAAQEVISAEGFKVDDHWLEYEVPKDSLLKVKDSEIGVDLDEGE